MKLFKIGCILAISIISHLGAESIKDESAYIDKRSQTLAEAVFWIQPGTEKRNVIRLFGVPDFKDGEIKFWYRFQRLTEGQKKIGFTVITFSKLNRVKQVEIFGLKPLESSKTQPKPK